MKLMKSYMVMELVNPVTEEREVKFFTPDHDVKEKMERLERLARLQEEDWKVTKLYTCNQVEYLMARLAVSIEAMREAEVGYLNCLSKHSVDDVSTILALEYLKTCAQRVRMSSSRLARVTEKGLPAKMHNEVDIANQLLA